MNLSDSRAIVTGAASGMGRYFALAFVKAGGRVFAADVDADGLASLAAEAGDGLYTGTCNVADEAEVGAMVDAAYEAMGGLNVLVNNAGIFRDGLLVKADRETGAVKKMSLKQWQQVIDVDLTGPFLCTRDFAAKLIETGAKSGVIVNMSSVARHGNRGQSNYSAAKAGLVADTKLWSVELAKHGIRVGAIAPGFVRTPILEAMRPEVLESLVSTVPVHRLGEPEEIWQGVKFIVECDYFTGRCIDIDGGLVI
jgi:3-oxoacyl-[acyl-carrier protein] reductase